ncbi:hypothetical protein EJ03DRAFT_351624 [Teratosphaeria nubilosa]|uniref:Aminoglycoside phosphotransferase domain-containing protein n=1 Tax=Teratosphaeria nubilosa TaxID=161662 RepID=A0A6G1L8P5_9PEZI|nr:hypothetical protein EJ03DRAFT_351624 [Teratosphaeria nubilosa]
MPHAVGESYAPGTVDEKVRYEAATYVWLERECPMIPIPRLLGMGFPGCQSFMRIENESWLQWTKWQNWTYSSTASYLQDVLAYQDARTQHQPNAILGRNDGIYQLSALVGLRAILPKFFRRESCREQYVMNLCDLHQSNIFVDDDWHITRIIDLEFACSSPIELLHVPHWLTDQGVDQLDGPRGVEYKAAYDQYVDPVAEREVATQGTSTLSQLSRENWSSGRMWRVAALASLNVFPAMFSQHLRPRYFKEWKSDSHAWPLAQLWCENVSEFLDAKARDLQDYETRVREVFAEVAAIQDDQSAAEECLLYDANELAKIEEPPVDAALCAAQDIGVGEELKD